MFLDSLSTKLDAHSFVVVSAQLESIRKRLFPEVLPPAQPPQPSPSQSQVRLAAS